MTQNNYKYGAATTLDVTAAQVADTKAGIVLANTYHLHLQPLQLYDHRGPAAAAQELGDPVHEQRAVGSLGQHDVGWLDVAVDLA